MTLPAPNYDEALVEPYQLPELLRGANGELVETSEAWQSRRRPELLELFRRYVYGRFELDCRTETEAIVADAPICGSLGRRWELDLRIIAATGTVTVRVLCFVPAGSAGPVPAFLGLNLFGNQTVHPDPAIALSRGWVADNADLGLVGNRATEASRGMHSGRFAVEMLLARGYAVITAYCGDIDPDYDDGFQNGVHALHPKSPERSADAGGSISAWAFGLSRLLDAAASLPMIDTSRVAVFGHSRLGKAALWAAAQDPRFAIAISNESGCVGATLSRRRYGERLLHITERFPHWFCPALRAYNEREHELPVDQHQLLALVAPRPLYVASAAADLWADPLGEKLALRAASPAYELFGLPGYTDDSPPAHLGYHLRPGKHDITPRDFWHYLELADKHLRGAAATRGDT